MIVVDVNIVAYFFIEGDKTASARDLARQLQTICVTEDRRLLRTFPARSRSMQVFAET